VASTADIRAWAVPRGLATPGRGPLPAAAREAYMMAHPNGSSALAEDIPGDDDFLPGDDDTAFAEPPVRPAPPRQRAASAPPADEAGPAEVRPVRPSSARARGTAAAVRKPSRGIRGLLARDAKPKGPKRARPRVPVDAMLAGVWRNAAKLARPMPPLYRTLAIQAPVAGILLEDSVKGTVVDTVLQPFARLAGQGRAASALFGPPVIVTALTAHIAQRAAAGEDPNPFIMSMGMEALRASLMTMAEVAGPAFEQALQKERDFEDKHGQTVDAMIAFLFSPPALTPEQQAAEEMAIRIAQGYEPAAA
jgi:hypothetical protein